MTTIVEKVTNWWNNIDWDDIVDNIIAPFCIGFTMATLATSVAITVYELIKKD